MSDLQDPIQSQLWDRVQEIKRDVYEGKTNSPEERAIAWRVAESEGDSFVVEKIKGDVRLPKDRFELADKFLSEAKETEDELAQEGIELRPVSRDTKEYMIEGLLMGITEYKENNNPHELAHRLSTILSIVSRAAEGVGFGNYASDYGDLGATYLSKRQVKELCEQVNFIALFGFVHVMNKGSEENISVYEEQKATLKAINSVSESIVL
ncbi:hypothetical protein CVU76_01060 [Candidatus Dojkabacteria bacterium HGW-Dojkabacteria-1]|uniref:Uncharacterized protein n=1 Tax=Candidatus Dojkabacteria bacterium HGW-Dojkabacteria-1 TaxID=2013761 RepID=A0A2N2F322_9BACT|nr:MAG: hypothetical protein CVU76_01060 [Candidatus Dojkabacteria bacterium HGW-Dojkabacteria-1]